MKTAITILALLGTLFVGSLAAAQEEPNLAQGLTPYGSFQGGNIDSVNLSNGNVVANMGLWRIPQRGGKLNVEYSWIYNNKSFFVNEFCDATLGCSDLWQPIQLGVQISNPQGASLQVQNIVTGMNNGQPSLWDSIVTVIAPDGSSHTIGNFPHTGYCGYPCTTAAGGRAADGSGWLLTSGGQLFDKQGILYGGAALAKDSNGNQIVGINQYTSNGGQYIQDTMGRVIAPMDAGGSNQSYPSKTTD